MVDIFFTDHKSGCVQSCCVETCRWQFLRHLDRRKTLATHKHQNGPAPTKKQRNYLGIQHLVMSERRCSGLKRQSSILEICKEGCDFLLNSNHRKRQLFLMTHGYCVYLFGASQVSFWPRHIRSVAHRGIEQSSVNFRCTRR